MKLLLCRDCQDIFNLQVGVMRSCKCGKVKGQYLDDVMAEYYGREAVPIGFANSTLVEAINKQPPEGMGKDFTAFVMPRKCPSFVWKGTF